MVTAGCRFYNRSGVLPAPSDSVGQVFRPAVESCRLSPAGPGSNFSPDVTDNLPQSLDMPGDRNFRILAPLIFEHNVAAVPRVGKNAHDPRQVGLFFFSA